MRQAVLVAVLAVLCTAIPSQGLQEVQQQQYVAAESWRAIKVKDERQLRAALNNPSLGWADRRVVQLTEDILIAATLTISSPVRIEGRCQANPSKRCTLRAALEQPLLHLTGPSALVQLGNLRLVGGQGAPGMGGAVTASNHSQVDLVSSVLSANSAPAGGAVLITAEAHLNLVDSEVSGNAAQRFGGGIMVDSGSLHLDRSVVEGNSAGGGGGGICAHPGAVLTALNSRVAGNELSEPPESGNDPKQQQQQQRAKEGEGVAGETAAAAAASVAEAAGDSVLGADDSSGPQKEQTVKAGGEDQAAGAGSGAAAAASQAELGVDILLRRDPSDPAAAAEAYFEPLPEDSATLVSGGRLQKIDQLHSRLPGRTAAPKGPSSALPSQATLAAAAASAAAVPSSAVQSAGKASRARRTRKSAATSAEARKKRDRPRRALRQSAPAGAAVTHVNSESDLAAAIQTTERYVSMDSHIILTGAETGDYSLLPSIKSSLTITGTCADPYNGKCLLNGQALGAILFADNTAFLPGMELTFQNIIFLNGQASSLQGGALGNTGAMSVTFINCDFVDNAAGTGGAVAMVEGAFSVFTDCTFKGNAAATDGSGTGTGGAVLLTGSSGFTRCTFDGNSGQNGGAVGVGGSSQGIFFDTCNFTGNSADIFGNDVYMESWVATPVYFSPYPTTADVYTDPANIMPISLMPPMYYPATVTSPPPSPPAPPSPPPPAAPSPPNPALWIYTEDQLWDALNNGNTSVVLGAHIQFAQQGKWAIAPPPTILSEVDVSSQCEGYGAMCIIDMAGSRFPLLDVQPNAVVKMSNVRVMNGATTDDGGAIRLTAPRQAFFDSCDFIGNYAGNGGAVLIKGAQNVIFQDCNFGLNWADASGGAVYSVGSLAFFQGSSFYLNHAASGGALALGPVSTAFVLDANFTRNQADKWGDDIFLATPVGSTLYLNQWPPESVANIFPAQAQVKWYFAPPPVPPSPPSPPPSFKRVPYPPPGPLPPARVNNPPPSPPNPPPFPPPRPPSPPMTQLVKHTPVMWGPMYVGFILLASMGGLIYCAVHQHRIFPRIDNPEELRLRLAGEYAASSDENYSLGDYSGFSDGSDGEVEVASGVVVPGALHRRRAREAAAAAAEAAAQDVQLYPLGRGPHGGAQVEGEDGGAGPSSSQHPKRM